MSICLGTLKSKLSKADDVEVWCDQFDDDHLRLEQGDLDDEGVVYLNRRQLQELSKIIDRFLDR